MPDAPTNFLEAESNLAQIAQDAKGHKATVKRGVEVIRQGSASLAGMPTLWADTISFIESQAAANVGDPEWETLKRRKDKIVADFQAMNAQATATNTAATTAFNDNA